MTVSLTAVYRPVAEGFVAFVEELPGANAQGATLDEARQNLQEAVVLVLEANRALSEEELGGAQTRKRSSKKPERAGPRTAEPRASIRNSNL
jgi:predicted RNase H-like HicB family nuclease